MVGRKSNMKILMSKLREVGVTIVKTTEFVQGQTCRWGLAWSFMPPAKKVISSHVAEKSVLSFTLEVWIPFSYFAWSIMSLVSPCDEDAVVLKLFCISITTI